MIGKNKEIDRKKPIKRLLDDFVIRNSSSLPQHQNQFTYRIETFIRRFQNWSTDVNNNIYWRWKSNTISTI